MNSEAACYDDGKALKTADVAKCLKDTDIKTIKVDPDETVRFGVDPEIADKGWTILLNGQPLTDSSSKTYRDDPGQRVLQRPVRRSGQLDARLHQGGRQDGQRPLVVQAEEGLLTTVRRRHEYE